MVLFRVAVALAKGLRLDLKSVTIIILPFSWPRVLS